jgi:hypothetical protein
MATAPSHLKRADECDAAMAREVPAVKPVMNIRAMEEANFAQLEAAELYYEATKTGSETEADKLAFIKSWVIPRAPAVVDPLIAHALAIMAECSSDSDSE